MTTETVSVLRETIEQLITAAKRTPWKTVGQANAIDEAEAALQQPAAPDLTAWKCSAKSYPPSDCDWPICQCDPVANKVMDALYESGCLKDGLRYDFLRSFGNFERVSNRLSELNFNTLDSAVDHEMAKLTVAGPQQPDIRTQPSMWTATIPATPKPSSVSADYVTQEQARQAFQASNIREQLLQYVPPVSEWPEGATLWSFDLFGESNYWTYTPTMSTNSWSGISAEDCSIDIPEDLLKHWKFSLFSIDDVKAARGE